MGARERHGTGSRIRRRGAVVDLCRAHQDLQWLLGRRAVTLKRLQCLSRPLAHGDRLAGPRHGPALEDEAARTSSRLSLTVQRNSMHACGRKNCAAPVTCAQHWGACWLCKTGVGARWGVLWLG